MVSEIRVVGVVDQSVAKRSAMVGVSVLVLMLGEEGEKHIPLLLMCLVSWCLLFLSAFTMGCCG